MAESTDTPLAPAVPAATDYADRLIRTRQRTLSTLGQASTVDLERVHTPILSPVASDLAHIAAFADLWLSRALHEPMLRADLATLYDAGVTPRAVRGSIPILDCAGALDYLSRVDERLRGAIPCLDLSEDSPDPLLRDGAFLDFLIEHEEQHRETMLQAFHIAEAGAYIAGPPAAWAPAPVAGPLMVRVPDSVMEIGARAGFSYDNERPPHRAKVPAFKIDRTPVTVAAYQEFIAAGGYDDPRVWSEAGWAWRQTVQVSRPLFWSPDGTIRRFDRIEGPRADHPVMNVGFYEADAFARWRGARLPTEIEWETAARLDPRAGAALRQPWGSAPTEWPRANVGGEALGPLPAGNAGAAPCGALGLIGDVWEWTSTTFHGYPGFQAFPYPEYSETFFDGRYRVLRGGSWATAGCVARATFRNWDFPERRQIFAGFRCAADA